MMLRWHQLGMERMPACQNVQMFFSEVMGVWVVSEVRISVSERGSLAST